MPTLLPPAELDALLQHLPGWQRRADGKAIERLFMFDNFNAAFGFMSRVALKAETLCHHPEWQNVYNRVAVTLTTHDVDGISALDGEMARFMDGIAGTQG